jgi:hypothetical protein
VGASGVVALEEMAEAGHKCRDTRPDGCIVVDDQEVDPSCDQVCYKQGAWWCKRNGEWCHLFG